MHPIQRAASFALIAGVLNGVALARQLEPPYFVDELIPGKFKLTTSLIADVNADGRPDVVVGRSDGHVAVSLGDGFGGFLQQAAIDSTLTNVEFLACADVQGDGALDLVIAQTQSVRVFLGDNLGHFAFGSALALAGAAKGLALGDVDSDGRADLAVSSPGAIVSVYVADASGAYATAPTNLASSGDAAMVRVEDVTGDGYADIATAVAGTGSVDVFAGDGQGAFSQYASWFGGIDLAGFTIADLDQDGVQDFLCWRSNAGVVSWLAGQGGGLFANLVVFTVAAYVGPVVVTDFDCDGINDVLASAWYAVEFLRGGPPGTLAAPIALPTDPLAFASTLLVADFDGDLDPDLCHMREEVVAIGENLGNGTIAQPNSIVQPAPFAMRSAAFADLDLDGIVDEVGTLDVWLSHQGDMVARLGDGNGSFGAPITSACQTEIRTGMRAGDLTGDGIPDVIAWNDANVNASFHVSAGLGDGTFAFKQTYGNLGINKSVRDIELGDFDADGDLDVYVLLMGPGLIRAYENTNQGTLVLRTSAQLPFPAGAEASELIAYDLNADGLADAVTLHLFSNSVVVATANGSGGFSGILTQAMGMSLASGVFADVDGDGTDELIAHDVGHLVGVWKRSFLTTFLPPTIQALDPRFQEHPPVPADLDDDGDVDIVGFAQNNLLIPAGVTVHVGAQSLIVLPGTGTPTLGAPRVFGLPSSGFEFGVFDANADSVKDVVVVGEAPPPNLWDQSTQILLSQCPGEIGAHGNPCSGSGGIAPRLAMLGCARPSQTLELRLVDALGGSFALLFAGVPGPSVPIGASGCFLHLNPLGFSPVVVPLGGAGAGAGTFAANIAIPASITNVTAELQALVADPGVPAGFAATNAVTVVIR